MGMFDSIDPSLTGEYDNYEESGFTKAVDAMPVQDKIALATAPVPILGDATGLFADAMMYWNKPEERNWLNYLMTAGSILPFIPNVASRKAMESFTNNMNNARDWFYSGVPGAQGLEIGKILYETPVAKRWQELSPTARARWENLGISQQTYQKNVKHIKAAKKLEEKIKKAESFQGDRIPVEWDLELNGAQLMESSGADGWMHLATADVDTVRKDYIKALRKKQVLEMQKLEGQNAQTMLFNKQYNNPNAKILDEQAALDYVGEGKMVADDFTKMVDQYDIGIDSSEVQELFDGIHGAQGVGTGKFGNKDNTILMMKRNKASTASGNLAHEMSATQKYSPNLHAFKKAMQNQPLAQPFKSVGEMIGEVKNGLGANPSKVATNRFAKGSKVLSELVSQNPNLLKANSVDEFMSIVKDMKVINPKTGRKVNANLNKKFIEDIFKMRQKKPFKNDKQLIAAIEANGGRVSNKKEVLEKGVPVRLADSHKSGAWELGGVNMQTVVRKDGTGFSMINDKNDIKDFNAPYADHVVTVSEPYVQNFGNLPVHAKRKAAAQKARQKAGYERDKELPALKERLGVETEGMLPDYPAGMLSPYQQATARAIETSAPTPSAAQYAKSLGNYAYSTGINAARPVMRSEEDSKKPLTIPITY